MNQPQTCRRHFRTKSLSMSATFQQKNRVPGYSHSLKCPKGSKYVPKTYYHNTYISKIAYMSTHTSLPIHTTCMHQDKYVISKHNITQHTNLVRGPHNITARCLKSYARRLMFKLNTHHFTVIFLEPTSLSIVMNTLKYKF